MNKPGITRRKQAIAHFHDEVAKGIKVGEALGWLYDRAYSQGAINALRSLKF